MEEKKEKAKEVKKPARKRVKKERVSPLIKEINVMLETGKYSFGFRKAYKELFVGNPQAVIIAEGSRKDIKEDIEKYAEEGDIPLLRFKGNSLELGSVCGKSYPISVIIVKDVGKSRILEIAEKG